MAGVHLVDFTALAVGTVDSRDVACLGNTAVKLLLVHGWKEDIPRITDTLELVLNLGASTVTSTNGRGREARDAGVRNTGASHKSLTRQAHYRDCFAVLSLDIWVTHTYAFRVAVPSIRANLGRIHRVYAALHCARVTDNYRGGITKADILIIVCTLLDKVIRALSMSTTDKKARIVGGRRHKALRWITTIIN